MYKHVPFDKGPAPVTVFVPLFLRVCTDFSPDSDQTTFHWRKRYYGLWTRILARSNTSWWICFSFSLLKMLTGGLEWCGLLWCFYQLFGLSFWRHPFTAEHPLLRHWCRDTFLQIWWRNKLILILVCLWMSTFSAHFQFWVNYSFNFPQVFTVCWLISLSSDVVFHRMSHGHIRLTASRSVVWSMSRVSHHLQKWGYSSTRNTDGEIQ